MSKTFKKILITGSSGTIGTRLFENLLEDGHEVVGFDKNPNKWHVHLDKLTVKGNLLNKKDIKKLPSDFDLVVHLAANARVYNLVIGPDLALENIITTYNILEFCRQNKIKSVIFASSRETYGNTKEPALKEQNVDIQLCESPYAASKISDEALVYSYSKCYGINYIVFRFSNVYGMYDLSDRFVPLMIKKMKRNESVDIYGGSKFLDFTYIDDCVSGLIKGIKIFPKAKNSTINVASGRGEKLTKVAQIIKEHLRSRSVINIKPNRSGEVMHYVADISRAEKLLDYKPKYSIKEGISSAVAWYIKN
jgi:UDP-glucose 4-epimerase